ncbi:ABC transporter ATP-binding protein, partial [Candidatus Peregrinibacteria bacterium]|nr:ABC transporter ATP-binding protein [Candidatus Peregrinibacteria bacterium]
MKQRNVLKHFLPEIKKYKGWLVLMVFSMVCSSLPTFLVPMKMGEIIDLMGNISIENYDKIISLFLIVAGIYIFMILAWRINEIAITRFETKGMRDISLRCFYAIQKHSTQFFENQFTGSLVKKVGRMVFAFEKIFDILYFNFLPNLLYIIFGLVIFSIKVPLLGALFFLWSLIFFGANYVFSIWKFKYDVELSRLDSSLGAMQADSFGNYESVKIFGQEGFEKKRYKETVDTWHKKMVFVWDLHNYANFFQASFMTIFELFLLYFAIQKWKEGVLSVGEIIFMQSYLLLVFKNLWDLGRQMRDFYTEIGNAYEMVEILEKDTEVNDIRNAKEIAVNKGGIIFNKVNFSYVKNSQIFKDFSLKIKLGEKVAIVGHSGSGKTT